MMTRIVRFNPWKETNEMNAISRVVDRWMEDAISGASGGRVVRGWNAAAPAIDLKETAEGYEVTAELPGWKPEDVDITFEKGVLTLKGEVKTEAEQNGDAEQPQAKWHNKEIRKASFVRSFSLPAEVEADKAQAAFEHGVLTLSLPKAEVMKPKQIKIAVK
jgi:HSP20 family protein